MPEPAATGAYRPNKLRVQIDFLAYQSSVGSGDLVLAHVRMDPQGWPCRNLNPLPKRKNDLEDSRSDSVIPKHPVQEDPHGRKFVNEQRILSRF
jgi:hypothetical protein